MKDSWRVLKDQTLGRCLLEAAQEDADKPFLIFEGRLYSYGEVASRVRDIAKGLVAAGVSRGDRVVVWLGNSPEWVFVVLSCVQVGAIAVPVNTRNKARELEHVMRDSKASLLVLSECFIHERLFDEACKVFPELGYAKGPVKQFEGLGSLLGVVSVDGDTLTGTIGLSSLIEGGCSVGDDKLRSLAGSINPADTALILYTSGTTGAPKGAELAHGSIVRRMREYTEALDITSDDVSYFSLPFYHFGGVVAVFGTMLSRGTLCFEGKFKPSTALKTIERHRCSVITGVTSMFQMMLEQPDFKARDLSSCRTGVIGGSSSSPDLIRRVMTEFVPQICASWGLTEATGMVTFTRPGDPCEIVQYTVGKPTGGCSVSIIDPETGEELGCGEIGEICVSSNSLMTGYFANEEATALALGEGSKLRTGDLGYLNEEGFLVFVGRLKDMIIVGGANVYPVEVENVIMEIDGVLEASVVAAPDARLGEVPCAFLRTSNEFKARSQGVIDYCREQLAGYKVPGEVRFVDDFPRTPSGKVQKFKLEKLLQRPAGQPPSD